jgi:hypothetical protein
MRRKNCHAAIGFGFGVKLTGASCEMGSLWLDIDLFVIVFPFLCDVANGKTRSFTD